MKVNGNLYSSDRVCGLLFTECYDNEFEGDTIVTVQKQKGYIMNVEEHFLAVKDNPFLRGYADKYNSYRDLPVLDKEQLRKLIDHNFKIEEESRGVHLLRTGGTTGESLIIPIDPNENTYQRQLIVNALKREGLIEPTDICINLFNYKHLYRSASLTDHIIERAGATSVGLGAVTPDEYVMNFSRLLKANTIVGTPTRVLQLANYLKEVGQKFKFRKMIFAGEVLPEYFLRIIREQMGVEKIVGLYGALEIGTFAYCDYTSTPDKYKILDSMVNIDIEQEDKEGYGNMIITNLVKKRFPVIKYRLGNIVRLSEEDGKLCFEIKSRGAFGFRIKQNYVFENDIKPIVKECERYQIILSCNEQKKTRISVLVSGASIDNQKLHKVENDIREVIAIDPSQYDLDVIKAIDKDYVINTVSMKSPVFVDERNKISI